MGGGREGAYVKINCASTKKKTGSVYLYVCWDLRANSYQLYRRDRISEDPIAFGLQTKSKNLRDLRREIPWLADSVSELAYPPNPILNSKKQKKKNQLYNTNNFFILPLKIIIYYYFYII